MCCPGDGDELFGSMDMEIWLTGNGELFLGVIKCGSLDDWK